MTPLIYRCEVCSKEAEGLTDGWYVLLTEDGKRYLCGAACLIKWAQRKEG